MLGTFFLHQYIFKTAVLSQNFALFLNICTSSQKWIRNNSKKYNITQKKFLLVYHSISFFRKSMKIFFFSHLYFFSKNKHKNIFLLKVISLFFSWRFLFIIWFLIPKNKLIINHTYMAYSSNLQRKIIRKYHKDEINNFNGGLF